MSRARTGRRQSGNPARRAAQPTHAHTTVLWPFAVDYFVRASRLGLYRDVQVVTVDSQNHLALPGVGLVPLAPETLPDPNRAGTPSVAAAVIAHEDADWVAIVCASDDPAEREQELLDGITDAFVDELGTRAAAAYARDAARARPILADPTEARTVIEALYAASSTPHH